MNRFNRRHLVLPLALAIQSIFSGAFAADFTVAGGVTDTTGKTITSGDTGTVQANGTLRTAGSTQAVTITGTTGTVTLNNSGLIEQTGTARAIRNNTVGITLIFNNAVGASITSVGDDIFKGASRIQIDNQGTLWQKGTGTGSGQGLDLRDVTATGNVIINGSATNALAILRADGDDALRPGANMAITNYGSIISNGSVNTKCPDYLLTLCAGKPSAHDAIDIGGNLGVSVDNSGTISGPRHGITADTSITVINQAAGSIIGRNGSGVGSDGTGTITNFGTISGRYAGAGNVIEHRPGDAVNSTASNGDGDGVDIDGIGTVINHGRIEGTGGGGFDSGGRPNGGDGVAMGGGSVDNRAGAVIIGASNGVLVDDGASGSALAAGRGTATSGAGVGGAFTILNAGTITGTATAGIGMVGTFDDTITNEAGGIITGGANTVRVDELASTTAAAAVQMGGGNDTLTNFGRIEGLNGKAIDMGTGNDTLQLFGGIVVGTLDGGAGTNTLETNGTQAFSTGSVLNFQNFIVRGGATTLNYALGSVGSVQIDAGGALKIEGAFATSGNLTVNGTLNAASSSTPRTTDVASNYAQGSGGVLETRIGTGGGDRIVVAGTATLANGATIRPLVTGFVPTGTTFKVITAGTLNATPASLVVSGGSSLLNFRLQAVNNELLLVTQSSNLTMAIPAALGATTGGIEALLSSGAAGVSTLLAALESLGAPALARATAQLAPETNSATQSSASVSQSGLFSAFGNRIDAARSGGTLAATRSGIAAGDSVGGRMWLEGLLATGKQDARGGADGYRLDAQGLGLGWERDLNASDLTGVSLGYTSTGSDGRDNASGDNSRVKSGHIGGYFSRTAPTYTLDASLVLSLNRSNTRRLVDIPGFTETNTGTFNGTQIGARAEYGVPFAMGGSWGGRWLIGARLSRMSNDAYTESGGVTAQSIGKQTADSVQSVLGAELTQRTGDGASLSLRARFLHEFADAPTITAAFVNGGGAFSLNGVSPARDSLQLGISYRRAVSQTGSLVIGYDADVREKYLGHQLSLRGQWVF